MTLSATVWERSIMGSSLASVMSLRAVSWSRRPSGMSLNQRMYSSEGLERSRSRMATRVPNALVRSFSMAYPMRISTMMRSSGGRSSPNLSMGSAPSTTRRHSPSRLLGISS